jgi:cytidine deaminase
MSDFGIERETMETLLKVARDAATRAYVPYSQFPVGAAALLPDGRIVTGCNVENASYPLSVCAERVAAVKVAELGEREIVAIAVTAPKLQAVAPCGGCRQVLYEFRPSNGSMAVIFDGEDGPDAVALDDLLPRAFGPARDGSGFRS